MQLTTAAFLYQAVHAPLSIHEHLMAKGYCCLIHSLSTWRGQPEVRQMLLGTYF